MSRERDGGREPRQDPASRLISDKEQAGKLSDPLHFVEGREEFPLEPRSPAKGARGGKQAEPLRFGPEREAKQDAPRQRRPDWKKASARKVREVTAPVEPEHREDIPPEQGQPVPEAVPETMGCPDPPEEGRAGLSALGLPAGGPKTDMTRRAAEGISRSMIYSG